MQKQVNISLTVGLADVPADRPNVDHEFAVVLAVSDRLPLDPIKLAVDPERKDKGAFGDLAS